MSSLVVRGEIVEKLGLDLIGPDGGHEFAEELLSEPPHVWYLTGFIVPTGARVEDRSDEEAAEEVDAGGDSGGADGENTAERKAAKRPIFPSSIGLSVMVPPGARELEVEVTWGDYVPEPSEHDRIPDDAIVGSEVGKDDKGGKKPKPNYRRVPRRETVRVAIPDAAGVIEESPVPNGDGLRLAGTVRMLPPGASSAELEGGRSVGLFLVNQRTPVTGAEKYTAFAFQARMEVKCAGFLPRPNLRGLLGDGRMQDMDEKIADLQYRDVMEFAVGHGVSASWECEEGECRRVWTTWLPTAQVERVEPAEMEGVELGMEALGELQSEAEAAAKLGSIAAKYEAWIQKQAAATVGLNPDRMAVAEELFREARRAKARIQRGIELLGDPTIREAFCLANRCMARAARQRTWFTRGKAGSPATQDAPTWRPFQLAFVLMTLPGIAEPESDERETVDLLFFPTGGGKTEAYLGLAAFSMIYRRLTHPGREGGGVSVLMRYTLRLLTLDQLGRAAGLICAMELERDGNSRLGDWPFEIGLWVGQGATPNRLGRQGDDDEFSAYRRLLAHRREPKKNGPPIPIEECPWCGTKFEPECFRMHPNNTQPTNLWLLCGDVDCPFNGNRSLPILAVDETIYRRLPAFLIATVDKFAALPWTGRTGTLFGRVQSYDGDGYYGPCDGGRAARLDNMLPGPDLVIQDELHLISGPLGTIAGLYETAIDALASREGSGRTVRAKIVASTATVRRADSQIRTLFDRPNVAIFPPPGPDRRDSFFAVTKRPEERAARFYVGIAAQGRSLKQTFLKTSLAVLSAAQAASQAEGGAEAADPYMTLLGYFNSLRELGGSRRIAEDDMRAKLASYGERRRLDPLDATFVNRFIQFDVMELTSRVSTSKVAESKRKLSRPHSEEHVDVALATNMISVGLDITRLGLMLVFGQPKTSSEYIQATSRVGRDVDRPGLVLTLLNVHKPRDRSHYERFEGYHASFYRSVEATSVTPYSPRALDRAFSAALVGLCRHALPEMTSSLGADLVRTRMADLEPFAELLARRARNQFFGDEERGQALYENVLARARMLLGKWSNIAEDAREKSSRLVYNEKEESGAAVGLLSPFLDPRERDKSFQLFRANRSMREVEQVVELDVKSLNELGRGR